MSGLMDLPEDWRKAAKHKSQPSRPCWRDNGCGCCTWVLQPPSPAVARYDSVAPVRRGNFLDKNAAPKRLVMWSRRSEDADPRQIVSRYV